MPMFVIEREMPGAASLSAAELAAAAYKSNEVLAAMSAPVQWQHSYVTDDKIYCVYIANDEEAVREHARRGGVPCNKISKVATIIDPTTGER
jgi:Protein of unknown function (DUF4242)